MSRTPFSDGWFVAVASATAIGAWFGPPHPRLPALLVLAALVCIAALWVLSRDLGAPRRWPASRSVPPDVDAAMPYRVDRDMSGARRRGRRVVIGLAVCCGIAGVAGVLARRAEAGLELPRVGRIAAEVTLVADPTPLPHGGVRAEARYRHKRVAVVAYSSAAAALDRRLAGERITVLGDLSPPGIYEQRLRYRHLVGRLQVETITDWRPGHRIATATNRLRRTLERGADALPERQRGLFLGVIIGDDRDESPDLVAAFRVSGLGHITAVSGQNVAFVVAAVAPLLRRLRLAPRLASTLGLLAAFAMLTRAEPSVLRATGMAAVAAYGAAVGRPATGVRALGMTVTVLVLCDPLLVTSLGFRLSVAGAAGIVLAAARLQRRLPGPEWLTAPVAVMLAAQVAVAPLLVGAFGSVALVSLPANLVAAPAVGPAMAWGLVAGLLGGLVGGQAAVALQLPTRFLLAWIEAVARVGARWPIAHLAARDLVLSSVVGGGALGVGLWWRWSQEDSDDDPGPATLNCHTP